MSEKIFNKIIFALYMALIIFLPAAFYTGFNSVFATAKLIVLVSISLLLLLLVGIYILSNKKVSIERNKWGKYMLLYLLVSVLGGIFSINIFSSFFGIYGRFIGILTLIHLSIIAFTFINFFPKNKISSLLTGFVVSASFISMLSLLHHYGVFELSDIEWTQSPSDRSFLPLGHANHLGAYLGMAFMVGVSMFSYFQKNWQKVLMVLCSSVILMGINATGSRGAFGAIILALLLWSLLFVRIHQVWFQKKIWHSLAGLALILVVLVALFPTYKAEIAKLTVVDRSLSTIEFLEDGNIPDRLSWWQSSLSIFIDRPIFGTGMGTFKDVYNEYRRLDYRVPGDIQDKITPESAHNEFINTLATQGALGLIAYLMMIFLPFWYLLKDIWRKNLITVDKKKYIHLGVLTALSVYIIQVQISFGVISTLGLFYVFLSIAAVISMGDKKRKSLNMTRMKKLISALIIVSIISFSSVLTYRRALAEVNLGSAMSSKYSEDKEKFFQRAIIQFPWEYNYYTEYADFAMMAIIQGKIVDLDKYINIALSHYEKAIALNDKSPVLLGNYALALFEYAQMKQDEDDIDAFEKYKLKGMEAFEKAISNGVNNPVYPYFYAQSLEGIGLSKEAQVQYERAKKIRPGYGED